jgi:hypothetical protein
VDGCAVFRLLQPGGNYPDTEPVKKHSDVQRGIEPIYRRLATAPVGYKTARFSVKASRMGGWFPFEAAARGGRVYGFGAIAIFFGSHLLQQKTFGTIFWSSFSKCQAALAHANRDSAGLSDRQ